MIDEMIIDKMIFCSVSKRLVTISTAEAFSKSRLKRLLLYLRNKEFYTQPFMLFLTLAFLHRPFYQIWNYTNHPIFALKIAYFIQFSKSKRRTKQVSGV